MLGDWEICVEAPPHEAHCEALEYTPACPRTRWWDECHRYLDQMIVSQVQCLVASSIEADSRNFAISQRLRQFDDLADHLGQIQGTHPLDFPSGEAWLAEIERLNLSAIRKSEAQRHVPLKESNRSTLLDRSQLSTINATDIPPFDHALYELSRLTSWDEMPRFWRTAYFDEESQIVVGVEGIHQRQCYMDSISFGSLPTQWLIEHRKTAGTMAVLDTRSERAEKKVEQEATSAKHGYEEDQETEEKGCQMIANLKKLRMEMD